VDDLTTLETIALIASPAFAAIAAGASWASVVQARRLARESSLPVLQMQPIVDPRDEHRGAVIHNAGSGSARGVGFVLVDGNHVAIGNVRHGFLRPGEVVHVHMDIEATRDGAVGMVVCRHHQSYGHAWTHDERHKVYRTWLLRRPRYPGTQEMFRDLFPDSADPFELTPAGFAMTRDPK
jgi:hypothetical protein